MDFLFDINEGRGSRGKELAIRGCKEYREKGRGEGRMEKNCRADGDLGLGLSSDIE